MYHVRAADLMRALALAAGLAWAGSAGADEPPEPSGGRALIIVGLPGDEEHEALFRETAEKWRDWLKGPLKFPAEGVRAVFGTSKKDTLAAGPATREAIK